MLSVWSVPRSSFHAGKFNQSGSGPIFTSTTAVICIYIYRYPLAQLGVFSISLWKLAGQPISPIGDVSHSYCPSPGRVKAVFGIDSLCRGICQNPDVKSIVAQRSHRNLQNVNKSFSEELGSL